MLKLKKIAVTGALCSGKSFVCDFLHRQNAFCVNADKIVHKLLSSDTECIKQVIELLGQDVSSKEKLSRKKIAQKVFSNNQEQLITLEKIIHPKVLREILQNYEKAKAAKAYNFFIAEVPLLYEIGWEKYFDHVIVVISDPLKCEERYRKKNGTTQEYRRRMKRQMNPEEKKLKTEFTITNNGSLEELKKEILKILPKLTS